MKPMHQGIPFSPQTSLSAAVGAADTAIPVEDVAAFPDAPGYATIGTDAGAETVLYTTKTETALSGCTRGVEGTAKAWPKGETVARNFTAADHAALIENVEALDGTLSAHTADAKAHVTEAEKAAWDAKETPEGAQEKADAAEAAAKAASRPKSWMPTAGGGIAIEEDAISIKVSTVEGNALTLVDGALYVPSSIGPILNIVTNPASKNLKVTAQQGDTYVTGQTDENGQVALQVNSTGNWMVSTTVNSETFSMQAEIPQAYEVKLDMVRASKILNENDWSTIRQISAAGDAPNYWSVGDTKTIRINGKAGQTTFTDLSVDAYIIGFDHNAPVEGEHLIHFQIGKIDDKDIALVDSRYDFEANGTGFFSMNVERSTIGGWNACQMRTIVLGNNTTPIQPGVNTLLSALPADLRAVMRPCTKYSDNTGGGNNDLGSLTATTDYLFLLSEFEYFGKRWSANGSEGLYQMQYDYYKAGKPKLKYRHDLTKTSVTTWTRSAYASTSDAVYSKYFCTVNTYKDGESSGSTASYVRAISPAFCV